MWRIDLLRQGLMKNPHSRVCFDIASAEDHADGGGAEDKLR